MKFPVVVVGHMVGFKKPIHKIVLWVLANHADNKTWRCNPSIARIAELSGIGERYAQKILRELEEDQYISRVGYSLGGNPGCTTIFLVHKGSALSKAIKSRSNKGNADSTALTPVLQNTPTPALEHTPTGVLKGNNPCPTVHLTPVLQNTLTTKELYITTTKEEFNKTYEENKGAIPPPFKGSQAKDKPLLTKEGVIATHGEEWKKKREVVAEIGGRLGIESERNEAALTYADRIEKALN